MPLPAFDNSSTCNFTFTSCRLSCAITPSSSHRNSTELNALSLAHTVREAMLRAYKRRAKAPRRTRTRGASGCDRCVAVALGADGRLVLLRAAQTFDLDG